MSLQNASDKHNSLLALRLLCYTKHPVASLAVGSDTPPNHALSPSVRREPRPAGRPPMQLPPENTARFYRIWLALLHYVNEQQHLVPALPLSAERNGLLPP